MLVNSIDKEMNKAITNGIFPGASLLVATGEEIRLDQVYGEAQREPIKRSMNKNTLFDIASLTKPFCTATLFMMVFQENKNILSDRLSKYFPSLANNKINVRQLLNHTSGLPAWKPYYDDLLKEAPGWMNDEKGKGWLLHRILKDADKAEAPNSTIYSDLGYILLGNILEKIYNLPLEQLFMEKIAKPLGLNNTFFNPLGRHSKNSGHERDSFASTNAYDWRGGILTGEVSDDHAWLMGGVAGHAGLFSTTHNIHRWLCELKNAREGKSSLISRETFATFCKIPELRNRKEPFFTLGFDTPSEPSSSGRHFSPQSLGHLGFTGTSFWWNLESNFMIVLFTNRVHPSVDNEKIREFRPFIHDVIFESLGS